MPNNDILCAIFEITANSTHGHSWATKPIWILSQVCTAWRTLAFATPTLWSKVTLGPKRYPNHVEYILRRQLAYATRLLDVDITWQGNPPALTFVLSRMLLEHKDIWTNCLVRSVPHSIQDLLDIDITLPKLKNLYIADLGGHEDLVRLTTAQVPALRSFSLFSSTGRSQTITLELPWAQLHELVLRGHGIIQDVNALRHLRSLKRLVVMGCPLLAWNDREDCMSNGLKFFLPNLRTLEVVDLEDWPEEHPIPQRDTSRRWFQFLFSTLVFGPKLRSLSLVNFPDHLSSVVLDNLEQHGSFFHLENISIAFFSRGSDTPALSMFQHFPNIVHLSLANSLRHRSYTIDTVFQEIIDNPGFYPKLQHLHFFWVDVSVTTLLAFCRAFFSNHSSGTIKLSNVRLSGRNAQLLGKYEREGQLIFDRQNLTAAESRLL